MIHADPGALQTGPRVLLRSPRVADCEEYLRVVRASRDLHFPWIDPATTEDDFHRWLARNRSEEYDALFVVSKGDGHLVGCFNLSQIFRGSFQNAYLGYWVGREDARRGLMSEALGLVLDHAFGTLGLHRVEANIQPQNTASRGLVRGMGFRREGFSLRYLQVGDAWRDHERWAITAEDRLAAATAPRA